MLTGEAKKEYQREYMRDYMRRRRAGLNAGSKQGLNNTFAVMSAEEVASHQCLSPLSVEVTVGAEDDLIPEY